MKRSRKRSTRQIRKSLHETRKQLDRNLGELEDHVDESFSPRNILSRHPALMTAAGAVIGLLVIRNPAIIGRALTRLAQASAPFLVRTVLQKGGSAVAHLASGLGDQASSKRA